MRFYDFPDVYDLFFTEQFHADCLKFFKELFAKKKYKDFLDCSVGTGQMAIPLAQIGYSVTGTDINAKMIKKATQNFARNKLFANLSVCDFAELKSKLKTEFDVVMCSGNSLGHAPNEQILNVIRSMDAVVRPGGMLYIDSKNWDNILNKKQRFYLFNPIIRDRGRVNYIQVWDYRKNGSIVFNYLIFEEVDNKIVSKRQFYEIYHPFNLKLITDYLAELNYTNINICKLGDTSVTDIDKIDWYALTAEKPISV
jgi:ubiquinone/menaquinone biosynthesis C-methylase UbiE